MPVILGRISLDGNPQDSRSFNEAVDRLRSLTASPYVECDVSSTSALAHCWRVRNESATLERGNSDKNLRVVADARIHNRLDLQRQLGLSAENISTEQLISKCYLKWGTDCPNYIEGEFAFAIFNARERTLFLARDHIGARPFFWARTKREVLFCSFIAGLHGFNDKHWSVNTERVAHYLMRPNTWTENTFFRGINSVRPGHWLYFTDERSQIRRWWQPEKVAVRENISLADAAEATYCAVSKAVKERLPTNQDIVGCHISGGVDSTIVAMSAARALRSNGKGVDYLYTWSPPVSQAYPDMGMYDERHRINRLNDDLRAKLRFGNCDVGTHYDFLNLPMEFQGTADLADELPVCAQARADGVSVMLSGWGGDELLSNHGVGYLASLLKNGSFKSLLSVLKKRRHGFGSTSLVARFFWRSAILPCLPDYLYHKLTPYTDIYEGGAFISRDLKTLIGDQYPHQAMRHVSDPKRYLISLLLSGHISERTTTWASWAESAGYEYRYPLLDRKLHEYLLSLPRNIFFGDGSPRYLVKQSFGGCVSTRFAKNDVANEQLRLDNRVAWIKSLQKDIESGKLGQECPWLDMDQLRNSIQQPIPATRLEQTSHFAKIFVALRAYSMYRRLA